MECAATGSESLVRWFDCGFDLTLTLAVTSTSTLTWAFLHLYVDVGVDMYRNRIVARLNWMWSVVDVSGKDLLR